ncbi:Ig-like domain-containing protein [Aeromicrobium endophyticum]|uniref:Ig-like domain repeat protein n=1 Tax=Aeromicrobium endophyticum TaxID=2292704 RepID=A0A371PAK9_9ACTN|nr:Ig-like domain-containing protein [Aeromicrobium endophyticum]REK72969.1 Ig-like domain repeat protein [Aeromicrobium endophyticum]
MNTSTTRRRLAVATLGLAVAASPLATGALTAGSVAAPTRAAATSVDTTYLTDTFPGLPASNILETVTYDRFQWLLRQPGQYAFVIGSAADAGFTSKVVQTEAAARAAGAKKVYWFDPNLTGDASATKNLDTRDPSGINLGTASQTIYGNTWRNALGQGLGNGFKAVTSGSTVTLTADDSVVNDAVDPLWDYRSSPAAAPAAADEDVFIVYDKNHTSGGSDDKIRSWVKFSASSDVTSDVTSALAAAGGASTIDATSQFAWWKDAANSKHRTQYVSDSDARYGGDILSDADGADGWNIQQITYPELLHLLDVKDDAKKNFVILFGGTWCHNTRAVLKHVNQEAKKNGTTVYNFDLVLDGGTVGGTNGVANPLHVRDNANNGSTSNYRPSWVYGDVVRKNFKNLVTENEPNTGSRVSYYPNGDTTAFPDVVRKLQVPFLINYQRGTGTNPSGTAVKRQWIQQNTDESTGLPTFREYMTEWWFTQPSAQLGLSFPIPSDESTLTDQQKQQLAQARANVAFAKEALDKLDDFFAGLPGAVVSTQTVTAAPVTYGTAPKVTVAIANRYGRIPSGTVTLSVSGRSYAAGVAQNAASFDVATLAPGSYPFTVSYLGGAEILPFQQAGTLTVTKAGVVALSGKVAKVPSSKKTGTYKVTVKTPAGLARAGGKVTVTFTKGKATKKVRATLKNGVVSVKVPKVSKGTVKVKLSYAGDASYTSAKASGKAISVKK